MIHFKLAGQEFKMPSHYGEMTFAQFFAVRDCDEDFLKLIEALSGIPRKKLEQISDLDFDVKIMPFLSFLKEKFDINTNILPDYIEFENKQYPRPKGIGINTYGQKLALQDEILRIEKEGKSETDLYPFALALYLQPAITGTPYDHEKVMQLVPKMFHVKLQDGWPIASFFLSKYIQLINRKRKDFLILLHQKRAAQVLKDSVNSESFQQLSLWRKLLVKALMRFYSLTGTRYLRHFGMKKKNQITKIAY